MNILGIDYGQSRIGLAWCDDAMGTVLPYGLIVEKGLDAQCQKIAALVQDERIDEIVIGLPKGLDGDEDNVNTNRVQQFSDMLTTLVQVPIHFMDERFSSQQADRMEGGDASRDEKSAMVILQSYVDSKK